MIGCPPFGQTTALLRRLLTDCGGSLERVDLIVQWEVARKRATGPPTTLLSTIWAPWWEFRLGVRVPSFEFRPTPRVDGGMLTVQPRDPALLPIGLVGAYANRASAHWPFETRKVSR